MPPSIMAPTPPTSCVNPAVEHRVRFDEKCVLIPEPVSPSRMPRLVRKSYSLPLWKRKPQEPSSDMEPDMSPKADEHVVLKLSVPSLVSQSQSPTRMEAREPLVPCIVNSQTSPVVPHPRPTRRASDATLPRPDCLTVPLRKCCVNCIHSTEECLKEGVAWKEHFTRGAERLRNSSVDSPRRPLRHRLCEFMPGFDTIVAVDEVDGRNGSRAAEPHPTDLAEVAVDPNSEEETILAPSLSRSHMTPQRAGRTRGTKNIMHGENDDMLFPLPRASPPVPGLQPSSPSASSDKTSDSPRTPSHDITVHDLPLPAALLYDETFSFDAPDHDTQSEPGAPYASPPASALSSDTPSPSTRVQVHHQHASDDSFIHQRKRTFAQYLGPASFFRVSADILKGVSAIGGGMPLST
ncbi:hypothetical protein B0H21DRAFT_789958 [Amylocystis lapponica]|nr:hypothetical protein B0H21DRAFT_789958 [Amylocystis lapponica]